MAVFLWEPQTVRKPTHLVSSFRDNCTVKIREEGVIGIECQE